MPFSRLNFLQIFKEYRDLTKTFSLREIFEIIRNLPAGRFSNPDVFVVNLHRLLNYLFYPLIYKPHATYKVSTTLREA